VARLDLGVFHAAVLLAVGLPLVSYAHPRIANEYDGPTREQCLEPPGFFGLNYGYGTPLRRDGASGLRHHARAVLPTDRHDSSRLKYSWSRGTRYQVRVFRQGDNMAYLRSFGPRATLLDVFRRFPATNKPLIEYHEALLRGPSPFTESERELIAAYVSGLNNCRYCHAVHTATAELLGVGEGVVPRLVEQFESADVPENIKPVLRYAQKLTDRPDSVSQADADAILAAGWDETAVYHTVAVTALFNLMNRLVEGLGIEFDPAYTRESSRRLAEGGYRPLLKMLGD
jgi:uncharacterized peroxidase-related enzyme